MGRYQDAGYLERDVLLEVKNEGRDSIARNSLTKWSSAASVASPLQRRVRPRCFGPNAWLRANTDEG